MTDKAYDPKSAIRATRQAFKEALGKPSPAENAMADVVDQKGNAYIVRQKPETLCFFLLEWLSGALKTMPEDMKGIASSAQALRAIRRPDGGIYLGLYSGGQVGDDVVVYGDPLMEHDQVIRAVHAFRLFHARQAANIEQPTGRPKLVVS